MNEASAVHARRQTLRVLPGRYVLERRSSDPGPDLDDRVIAAVRGPDGGAIMRRQDSADDGWIALWNGDAAHPPDATGMLASIVGPLAAADIPVWVAASYDGDIVMVPASRHEEASHALEAAGHRLV